MLAKVEIDNREVLVHQPELKDDVEAFREIAWKIESADSVNLGSLQIYLHPSQQEEPYPRLRDIVAEMQAREDVLSYSHLKWLSENPFKIPLQAVGSWIVAWDTVVSVGGALEENYWVSILKLEMGRPEIMIAGIHLDHEIDDGIITLLRSE